MIRTHKPSGHHWTCASHFQQSKQYRNLDAQDWHAPSAKILVADPDDDLPTSLRVAKRRRVEQLANDFLEGQPLFISSACANGPDLTATVDKVLCDKRLTWDEVLDDHDEDLWADEEDGWAELKKRSKARAALRKSRSQPSGPQQGTRSKADAVTKPAEVTRTQNTGPTARVSQNISLAPSDETLLIAAKLRARKTSLLEKVAERPELLAPPTTHVTQSAPPTARATTSFKECSSSRPFDPNTPAETTMADELRLSRTDSPFHRPRAFTMPVESFSSETTVEDPSTGEAEPTATGSTAMELCTAEQNIASSAGVILPVDGARAAHTNLSSNPRPSAWTPINEKQTRLATSTSGTAETPHIRSARRSTSRSTKSTPHQKTGNTTASFGETSQPKSQSRLTNSFKASKPELITAGKSQNGSTPFVYRKKSKTAKDDDLGLALNSPGGDEQRSSNEVTPKPNDQTALPSVSAAPPNLDLSFMQDSSFAPALNMALVDEHINKRLPNSPGSAQRSSSVKKALRSEMRLSGADISRVPGDLSSSQSNEPPEETPNSRYTEGAISDNSHRASHSNRQLTGQWPGTQVLLNRAQHDLFMSPDKVALANATLPDVTRLDHMDSSEMQQLEELRAPLRQLSQEHFPGTQALMDNWSPWSTVKKLKPGKRGSFVPSPFISKNMVSPGNDPERLLGSDKKPANVSERVQHVKQRRSSLRFASSTSETPLPQKKAHVDSTLHVATSHSTEASINSPGASHAFSQIVYGHTQPDPSTGIDFDFTGLSFAATAAQPIADVDGSMADWSSHDKISFLHNAQRTSVEPPPEEVLADMATEFLSTADIDGVLGKA
ncbi:hypothetical protein MBLNU13_g09918t1 [Cladosporium sp. NU13]